MEKGYLELNKNEHKWEKKRGIKQMREKEGYQGKPRKGVLEQEDKHLRYEEKRKEEIPQGKMSMDSKVND